MTFKVLVIRLHLPLSPTVPPIRHSCIQPHLPFYLNALPAEIFQSFKSQLKQDLFLASSYPSCCLTVHPFITQLKGSIYTYTLGVSCVLSVVLNARDTALSRQSGSQLTGVGRSQTGG